MSPAFDPGDRAYIRPSVPVVAGNYVLFIRTDEHGVRHAMIKKLRRATERSWQVEQFNPAKVFELPRSQWQTAYRIVGSDRSN
jgi:phage repressor protein C with HTH and peptisase S24 domain